MNNRVLLLALQPPKISGSLLSYRAVAGVKPQPLAFMHAPKS
jgi:hypothetical protein